VAAEPDGSGVGVGVAVGLGEAGGLVLEADALGSGIVGGGLVSTGGPLLPVGTGRGEGCCGPGCRGG